MTPNASAPLQVWERQPYETESQWNAFKYYRDMPQPRSVDGAYRRYLAEKNGVQPADESVARKRAVGGWQFWSRGRDWQNEPIPGAKPWDERAQAYDLQLERQADAAREQEVAKKRKQLIRDEIADYERQRDKWLDLWERTRLHEVGREVTLPDGSKAKLVEPNVDDWLKLAKLRDLLSEQGRRALGLPRDIAQTQLTGADGGPVAVATTHVDDLATLFQQMKDWEKAQRDADDE